MKKYNAAIRMITLSMLLLGSFAAGAKDVAQEASQAFQITLATIIYVFTFILLMIGLSLWLIARHLKRFMKQEFADRAKAQDEPGFWTRFFQIRPSKTDKDHMINHPHDGIYELDNPAPPWFMFLFYATIAFGVIYYVRFTFSDSGYTQMEEYEAEMKEAKGSQTEKLATEKNVIDENSVVYLQDEASLAKGKSIYDGNCKLCHGDKGEGKIGPNFTDDYFMYGGSIQDIFKIIKYGVVEKGMVPWGAQLGPEGMQQVASFVKSLQGTDPGVPGKEPQGEKYTETNNTAAGDTAADK